MDMLDRFSGVYDFPLDSFQREGTLALVEGRSVLVAAPTGAGKTVVGEFAVWLALERGGKCFYTTPIKALSNQKYNDLVRRHGPERVGLLTGDNAVNGDAPIVVMTTEVLRNMLYEGSRALVGLHAVVLDEVHYLADRSRGAVWEEVIVQLPASVQLACLSATVSNAEEFGAWLASVRDSCDVVISEHRPVPLEHHYAVNDRLYPTFKSGHGKSGGAPQAQARSQAAKQALGGVPNPEVVMLERRSGLSNRRSSRGRQQHSGIRLRPPRRSDVVRELRRRRWLPAIYFLFSRSGCDDAVKQLMADGVRLTVPAEQQRIRELVDAATADIPPEDLDVLGYGTWAQALEAGVAAHHAGMVPVFKEVVEELFVRGLVKVCFATETLALGINMPARTVVIERLEKWNGARHELLTPGQFTQLTGRAGRRGLDTVGHAVVLYQRDVDFPTVASLVGRRTEPLRSSFTPSYNMAVNLLRRHSRADAEALLARSFAQFQVDATVAGEEERIARNRAALAGYAGNLRSEVGDFEEYWALRRELSHLESKGAKDRRKRREDAVHEGIALLREGDVVALPSGLGAPDLVAIVGRSETQAGAPLASAVTLDRKLRRLGPRDFDAPPDMVGRVRLPQSGGPRQANYRKEVASQLRELPTLAGALARGGADGADGADGAAGGGGRGRQPDPAQTATAQRVAALRDQMRSHPVHTDPQLRDIERWAHCHDDLLTDTERLERAVRRRTGSIVLQFDRICRILTELGYLERLADDDDSAAPGLQLTADGLRLAGLYAETDLVLAESLRRRAFDGLTPAELAAAISLFTFETRAKEAPPVLLPTGPVAECARAVHGVWIAVAGHEEAAGLPTSRVPDPGLADAVWRWADGADLDVALGDSQLTAGDFVRGIKQVADLLRQLRDAVAGDPLSAVAAAAARSVVRGVVAYSGM